MKLFAFALIVAAVAAEDAARSARSLVGWGHGLAVAGVPSVVAAPALVAPAPIAVASPVVLGHGVHGAPWAHGIHRRSLLAPAVIPHAPWALSHGVVSHGWAAPAVVGHGLVGPAVVGHGVPLLRHVRSLGLGVHGLGVHGLGVHGLAVASPHVAVAPAVIPAIGHGIGAIPALRHGIGPIAPIHAIHG